MSNKPTNDRRLEAFKIFPYVAWFLTFLFAYFVYTIVVDLREVTNKLQVQADYLQQQVKTPPEKIKSFEREAQ